MCHAAVGTENIRSAMAFAVLFIATLIVGALFAWFLARLAKFAGLSGMDGKFGAIFGMLRGGLVVIALVWLGGLTDLPSSRSGAMRCRASRCSKQRCMPRIICRSMRQRNRQYQLFEKQKQIMCGILGVVAQSPVNQLLYDGLQVLQHRGQDAAGIATLERNTFHLHKGNGLGARRVPHPQHARADRQCGHCPRALSDCRFCGRSQRGAAVLCQFAVRPGAGAQRQPDQYRRSCKKSCSSRTCAM